MLANGQIATQISGCWFGGFLKSWIDPDGAGNGASFPSRKMLCKTGVVRSWPSPSRARIKKPPGHLLNLPWRTPTSRTRCS